MKETEKDNTVDMVKLERYKVGVEQELEKEFFDYTVDIIQDAMRKRTMLRMTGWVLCDNFKRYEHKYPKDWKEAFKERWFPQWWLKKKPVKYKRIVVRVDALYPKYKPKIPNEKYCFHLNDYEDEIN